MGGGICLLGEVLRQSYLAMGVEDDLAGTLTSCSLIVLSAVLTTLGWYQKLAAKAGAGSLVPITGFANAVVSAAIEFKAEGRVLGTGAKMWRRWCTARCCGCWAWRVCLCCHKHGQVCHKIAA